MNFDEHDGNGQIQEIGDLSGGVSSYVGREPPSNFITYPSPLPVAKQQPPPPPTTTTVSSLRNSNSGRYRECLKNHAVGIGGHALDGCGEFMPAGEDGTIDALKCAACNCHRNFHRKEVLDGIGVGFGLLGISDTTTANTPSPAFHQTHFSPYYRTPTGYQYPHIPNRIAPPPLFLPSPSGGGREDPENMTGGSGGGSWRGTTTKKRCRTKFTAEQKDKMLDLADRLGWRMQKHDESLVQQFCAETGVQRHVLKVWMHNNKHTLGKSPTTSSILTQQAPPAQVINNLQ